MIIKQQYINEMIKFSNNIQEASKRLGYICYNETLIKDQKNNLIQQIKNINNEKDILIGKIVQEYGEGYVNPSNWQFIPKEQPKQNINQEK